VPPEGIYVSVSGEWYCNVAGYQSWNNTPALLSAGAVRALTKNAGNDKAGNDLRSNMRSAWRQNLNLKARNGRKNYTKKTTQDEAITWLDKLYREANLTYYDCPAITTAPTASQMKNARLNQSIDHAKWMWNAIRQRKANASTIFNNILARSVSGL